MEYKFTIVNQTVNSSGGGVSSGVENIVSSTIGGEADIFSNSQAAGGFGSAMAKKATNSTVQRFITSPLNQATGGLASPAYGLGRSIMGGAGAAAIGGGVAMVGMAAVNLTVQKIQERLAKMEAKASAANERDNVLIRSGAKNYASYYTGGIMGVKSNTDRR